jgi:uncharacterized membrane protein
MKERLKGNQFTDAIIRAIFEIGTVLQRHFPASRDDANELPNAIAED